MKRTHFTAPGWNPEDLHPYFDRKPRLSGTELTTAAERHEGYYAIREPDRDTDYGWSWYFVCLRPSDLPPDGGLAEFSYGDTVCVIFESHGTVRLTDAWRVGDIRSASLAGEVRAISSDEFAEVLDIAATDTARLLEQVEELTRVHPAVWRRPPAGPRLVK